MTTAVLIFFALLALIGIGALWNIFRDPPPDPPGDGILAEDFANKTAAS